MTISPAIERAAASTRTAPSRQFMVQQAVLNAAAELYPQSAVMGRLARIIDEVYGKTTLQALHYTVLAHKTIQHFRIIAAQYQAAP